MLSSIQWFKKLYAGNGFKYYPVIMHRASTFDTSASTDPRMRVMNEPLLEQFKGVVKTFAEGSVGGGIINNVQDIQKLIIKYKLNGTVIIDAYTVPAK